MKYRMSSLLSIGLRYIISLIETGYKCGSNNFVALNISQSYILNSVDEMNSKIRLKFKHLFRKRLTCFNAFFLKVARKGLDLWF